MKEQIENVVSRVADTARDSFNSVVDATQDRVGQASKVVAEGKKPVQKMSKATLEANAIAFRTSKELIELQSKSMQNGIDAIAKRLKETARVDSVRALLAQQRDVVPGVARFYLDDIKSAFGIVRGAAGELGGVITGLRDSSPVKKAKKTARTAAKKAPARAKAAAKSAANKVAKTVTEVEQAAQTA